MDEVQNLNRLEGAIMKVKWMFCKVILLAIGKSDNEGILDERGDKHKV